MHKLETNNIAPKDRILGLPESYKNQWQNTAQIHEKISKILAGNLNFFFNYAINLVTYPNIARRKNSTSNEKVRGGLWPLKPRKYPNFYTYFFSKINKS